MASSSSRVTSAAWLPHHACARQGTLPISGTDASYYTSPIAVTTRPSPWAQLSGGFVNAKESEIVSNGGSVLLSTESRVWGSTGLSNKEVGNTGVGTPLP